MHKLSRDGDPVKALPSVAEQVPSNKQSNPSSAYNKRTKWKPFFPRAKVWKRFTFVCTTFHRVTNKRSNKPSNKRTTQKGFKLSLLLVIKEKQVVGGCFARTALYPAQATPWLSRAVVIALLETFLKPSLNLLPPFFRPSCLWHST